MTQTCRIMQRWETCTALLSTPHARTHICVNNQDNTAADCRHTLDSSTFSTYCVVLNGECGPALYPGIWRLDGSGSRTSRTRYPLHYVQTTETPSLLERNSCQRTRVGVHILNARLRTTYDVAVHALDVSPTLRQKLPCSR